MVASHSKVPGLFLLAVTVGVGFFFFRVVQPFVLPLVFACVLAVLFWPVYQWITKLCCGHSRIAAAITTLAIILIIVVPLAGGLAVTGYQLLDATKNVAQPADLVDGAEELMDGSADILNRPADSSWERRLQEIRSRFSSKDIQQIKQALASGLTSAAQSIYARTTQLMADLFSFVIGAVVMVLGLYYFLADNESILTELQRLSPLRPEDDRELWDSFVQVCRGVLLGNVLAAALQAILNGIGFAALGIEAAWVLAFCTFFFSFVPFVGAGAVWLMVTIGLVLEQRYWAAASLVVYGTLIVSSVDNLVRAFAIRGTSHIHPLIALVSILGAIQIVGLWGVVIGPVTAAFFYALLNLLNKKFSPAAAETSTFDAQAPDK